MEERGETDWLAPLGQVAGRLDGKVADGDIAVAAELLKGMQAMEDGLSAALRQLSGGEAGVTDEPA